MSKYRRKNEAGGVYKPADAAAIWKHTRKCACMTMSRRKGHLAVLTGTKRTSCKPKNTLDIHPGLHGTTGRSRFLFSLPSGKKRAASEPLFPRSAVAGRGQREPVSFHGDSFLRFCMLELLRNVKREGLWCSEKALCAEV